MRISMLRRAAGLLGMVAIAACDRPTIPQDQAVAPSGIQADKKGNLGDSKIRHVLLISVDGLHAVDLARYVNAHPGSAFARLSQRGITFGNASTAKPSDSWPGLLAIVTGGSPRATGIMYEDSYDRSLSAPGSACATVGTEVNYSEIIDVNLNLIDGGGGIDPTKLPLDPRHGCTPVYPHSYLRVNTIFEVIKAAGLRTAWSDKSLGYEVVNGPSGHGVDDLFTPEIAAPLPNGETPTTSVADVEIYDSIKVRAILNEIDGKDHTGSAVVGVPAIFGMNFQAVSVGQKTVGYLDGTGTPSAALQNALDFVDGSIDRMVSELKARDVFETTLIVISAKHGQAPIDPGARRIVSNKLIPNLVNAVQSGLLAQGTLDDIALLWLTDQNKTGAVVSTLNANRTPGGIDSVLAGSALAAMFNDPAVDPRAPDAIAVVLPGVIYAKPTATKQGEHGGFGHDDTNVPILVSGLGFHGGVNLTPVTTAQIAPTILAALGLDPRALRAVRLEGTSELPIRGDRIESGEGERTAVR